MRLCMDKIDVIGWVASLTLLLLVCDRVAEHHAAIDQEKSQELQKITQVAKANKMEVVLNRIERSKEDEVVSNSEYRDIQEYYAKARAKLKPE